jgi:hypothetical protein
MMSLGMNMCLCYDLILTLKSPFYPAKRRLKYYLAFSFLMGVTMSAIAWPQAHETCKASNNSTDSNVQNAALAFALSLYILISVYSIIFAARMLSRPGISAEIRGIFMKKHVIYTLSFICIWSIVLLNAYHSLYDSPDKSSKEYLLLKDQGYSYHTIRAPMGIYITVLKDEKNYMHLTTFQILSFIASISTGLLMGIIRCFEPYFYFLLKKTIKAFYGIPLSEEEITKKNSKLTDTFAAFLNSSLNIELVHIILKAITQECTKTSLPKDGWKTFIPLDQDFDERKIYEMHEIEIKDPKKWKLFDDKSGKALKTNNLDGEKPYNAEKDTLMINENISIEELAPKIFSIIRNKENITGENIIDSLSPEANRDMVFKAGEGQGKSGSFFFFSHDGRFIIKSMNDEEYKTFQGIFKDYYRYLIRHDDSLIARIFGIFTVNKEKLTPVHLILMDSTVQLQGKKLKYMFDLKGSFANRETKVGKVHKPGLTLKDINLLNVKMNDNILKFKPDDAQNIMDVIKRDVPILEKGNIMDYSLLLAIEENPDYKTHTRTLRHMSKHSSSNSHMSEELTPKADKSPIPIVRPLNFTPDDGFTAPHSEFQKSRHKFLSSNLQYIYHISIIDYLQDYNFDKKSENLFKTIMRGKNAEISAVPPERYAKRYIEFMENSVIVTDKRMSSVSSGDILGKIDEEIEEVPEGSYKRAESEIW